VKKTHTKPRGGTVETMNTKNETKINIMTLVKIRDNVDNLPAVRVQAIQTMQKLIAEDDPETQKNMKVLKKIRDSEEVTDAVRIQTIQTMHKIFALVNGEETDDAPTEADIMAKIRKAKK